MQSQPFSMCWDFYLWAEQMIFFRRNKKLRRFIAVLLMFTSAAVPFHVIAAEVKLAEIGKQAQSFGNMALGGMELGSESSGELYFPNVSEPITINDLYPSTSGKSSLPASKFFPGQPDVDSAKGMYESDSDMSQTGQNRQEELWSDAMSDDPTLYGAAYKMILDAKKYSRPDFSNDPMLNQSKGVYENMDLIAKGFGDCKVEDSYSNSERVVHVPDYQQCERIKDLTGEHRFRQKYDLGLIQYVKGQPNYSSCGKGCLNVWVGTVGDNYWGGSCTIYQEFTEFAILNKDAIISATIDSAAFDDYFQVWFNDQMVWTHTPGIFPPETAGSCERGTNWRVNPNTDITNILKSDHETIRFKTRTSVTGGGEGFARIRIMYDPSKAFNTKGWSPAETHKDVFDQIGGGYCSKAVASCVSPPGLKLGDCVTSNGVTVCPSDVPTSAHPAINPLCAEVTVSLECSTQAGDLECWEDVKGETHCPTNEGNILNSCEKLEKKGCGFISSTCLNQGPNGACYIYEDKYDCGENVRINDIDKTTEYKCSGEIKCMGSDCIDIAKTQNGDFSKAASLLHAAQHMAGDLVCDERTGGQGNGELTGSGCTVFKGTSSECKKALGGTVDCCESPDGVNFGDYLSMLTNMPKIDTAIMSISDTSMFSGVKSGYAYLRDPVVSSFKQVTSPFTSYIDSVTGAVDALKSTATDLLNKLTAKAQEIMIESLRDIGLEGLVEGGSGIAGGSAMSPELAADFVGPTQPATASGLGSALGSVISFIGWVYLIYQVAMLIIQIIYECTKEELTLGVDRELKKCTFVGSYCASKALGSCIEKREAYCCFPSPLARIIQEQGKAQLGKTFGEGKSPQCDGLTIEEIEQLDWDKMDLGEWVGMLQQHDLFHDASTIDLDKLTGAGTTLDIQGGNRLNALERTFEREKDTDIDNTRLELSRGYNPPTGAPSGD